MNREPDSRIAEAADVAFDAVNAALEQRGLELRHALIMLVADGTDEGEPSAMSGSYGLDDDLATFEFMFVHLRQVGLAIGIDLKMTMLGEG